MSATPNRKTERYVLGELLRDAADHLLLLTATPHKGDPVNFSLFLQLLDEDAYADMTSIRQAMERRRAPFYLRRTKEAMVHFPERMPDGTWQARKIFTKRVPKLASTDCRTCDLPESRRCHRKNASPVGNFRHLWDTGSESRGSILGVSLAIMP